MPLELGGKWERSVLTLGFLYYPAVWGVQCDSEKKIYLGIYMWLVITVIFSLDSRNVSESEQKDFVDVNFKN